MTSAPTRRDNAAQATGASGSSQIASMRDGGRHFGAVAKEPQADGVAGRVGVDRQVLEVEDRIARPQAGTLRRPLRREVDDEAGPVHGRADAGVDGAAAADRMDAAAGRDDVSRRQRAVALGGGHEPPRRQDEADEDAARARHRHRADEMDGERREDPGVQQEAQRERHAPPAPRCG